MTSPIMVHIWSNEHNAWWRPKSRGYTNYRSLAGEYTLAEATEICNSANKHIDFDSHEPTTQCPTPNETIAPIE